MTINQSYWCRNTAIKQTVDYWGQNLLSKCKEIIIPCWITDNLRYQMQLTA